MKENISGSVANFHKPVYETNQQRSMAGPKSSL